MSARRVSRGSLVRVRLARSRTPIRGG